MIGAALLTLASSHQAVLACGPATFRVTSRTPPDSSGVLAPSHQVLRRKGQPRPVQLDRLGTVTVDSQRVQRAFLLSWACVRASSGARYVLLGYACAIDPGEPGACPGGKEWFRLADTRGRRVAAGVPIEGPRWSALLRRLGLARVMAAGVPMTNVLG